MKWGEIKEDHRLDADGNPSGGFSTGVGIDIKWQDGPLGGQAPTGACVEDVIRACLGRLHFYQEAANGRFAHPSNGRAMTWLAAALDELEERTREREARGVEGQYLP